MVSPELNQAAQWLLGHGYSLMFILMLIEGTAVTAAGAFAAALGYFNLWAVFLLSILGNLVPDVIYYAIGFWGRGWAIDRYGRYFGFTPKRVAYLEKIMRKHAVKSLIFVKMTPFLATPGLIIAGATKMEIKKYAWWSLIITAPSSLFFLVIGYYFGFAYEKIVGYLNYGGYLIVGTLAIFIVMSYLYKKFSGKIAERLEKP